MQVYGRDREGGRREGDVVDEHRLRLEKPRILPCTDTKLLGNNARCTHAITLHPTRVHDITATRATLEFEQRRRCEYHSGCFGLQVTEGTPTHEAHSGITDLASIEREQCIFVSSPTCHGTVVYNGNLKGNTMVSKSTARSYDGLARRALA